MQARAIRGANIMPDTASTREGRNDKWQAAVNPGKWA
jgi:hypothetical protein